MRNPRACGSLAQHSGVFVLMFLYGLMFLVDVVESNGDGKCFRQLDDRSEEDNRAGDSKADAVRAGQAFREFHRQWPMPRAGHIFTKLLLVRRENADAAPPARNGHIPLLSVRCGLDRRIGKQDVIYGFAL